MKAALTYGALRRPGGGRPRADSRSGPGQGQDRLLRHLRHRPRHLRWHLRPAQGSVVAQAPVHRRARGLRGHRRAGPRPAGGLQGGPAGGHELPHVLRQSATTAATRWSRCASTSPRTRPASPSTPSTAKARSIPLPDDVSLERGAMLEPVTIAVHAVDQGNICPGKTVAICGGGTIGLLVQQIAMRAGAARVLVSDPMPEKREMAKRFGADWTIDPLRRRPGDRRPGTHGGRGFDTVFECSGKLTAAKQALMPGRQVRHRRLGGRLSRRRRPARQSLLHVRQRADHTLHHPGALRVPAGSQASVQAGSRAA